MFVGYAEDHSGNVFRMYDMGTKGIKKTRDVLWLNKTYGIWNGIVEKELSTKIFDIEDEDGEADGDQNGDDAAYLGQRDETESKKVSNELRRLNNFYNPTLRDVVDFAMVGGTDHNYINPVKFDDAWNHEDPDERALWPDAMSKEINDMVKKRFGGARDA